jgi:hypothetical protein
MKYQAPYGVSDPNAAYINGNPSTGTMGSIPPAASIEYPQREIVNFITASGLTPTDADLLQLAKSVQSGHVNFGADQGTPNQIAITLNPAIAQYSVGLRIIVKVAYANTTQAVVNVNAIGSVPLVHGDLSQLSGAELHAGQIIECVYDGANFQLISGGAGGVTTLTATRDVYVSDAIGNDTTLDGSQATVSGAHGPFKTITRAMTEMAKYNLGGWNFQIHVADGTYNTSTIIDAPLPNGSGMVKLIGNHANPIACHIANGGQGSALVFQHGGTWSVDGFAVSTVAAGPGDSGCGVFLGGSVVNLLAMAFGPCHGDNIHCAGGTVFAYGPFTVYGACGGSHLVTRLNGIYVNNTLPPAMSLAFTSAVNFPTSFINVTTGGQAQVIYGTMTGGVNVSGTNFSVSSNGVIDTGGRGSGSLPGSVGGTPVSGGQLI